MAFLWYPGQDPDFMRRLERIEKFLAKERPAQVQIPDGENQSVAELEAENAELRIRIDSLEEDVINLRDIMGEIEEHTGCKVTSSCGTFPKFGEDHVKLRRSRVT